MTTLDYQRQNPKSKSHNGSPFSPREAANPVYKDSSSNRVFALALCAVLAVALLSYVLLCYGWCKFSRAEVFFGECAKEMVRSGNWMVPTFQGQGFFDKPILSYWAVCASYIAFGISHLAARIPSCIAATATVLVTALAARKIFDAKTGLVAAMTLSTSVMFMSFAAMCMSDMLLILFNTAALLLLYFGCEAASNRQRTWLWLSGAAAVGLAFLTKGPIGIVFPAITFFTYLAVTRRLSMVRPIHYIGALMIVMCIGSPWFLAMYSSHPDSLSYFFLRENFQRFAGATYDSHQPPWFIVHSLITGFAPWSPLLIVAAADMVRQLKERTATRPLIYLWLSVITIIGFFSLSRGKIDYYALPAYPMCAILTAHWLTQWTAQGKKLSAIMAAAISTILIAGAFVVASLLPPLFGSVSSCLILPATLLVSGLIALFFALTGLPIRSVAASFVGIATTCMVTAMCAFPLLDKNQPMYTYIKRIEASSKDTVVGIFGMDHWRDEVIFRTERKTYSLTTYDELFAFFKRKEPVLVVVPAWYFDAMLPQFKEGMHVIESHPYIPHGLNPGHILEKGGRIVADSPLLLLSNKK